VVHTGATAETGIGVNRRTTASLNDAAPRIEYRLAGILHGLEPKSVELDLVGPLATERDSCHWQAFHRRDEEVFADDFQATSSRL